MITNIRSSVCMLGTFRGKRDFLGPLLRYRSIFFCADSPHKWESILSACLTVMLQKALLLMDVFILVHNINHQNRSSLLIRRSYYFHNHHTLQITIVKSCVCDKTYNWRHVLVLDWQETLLPLAHMHGPIFLLIQNLFCNYILLASLDSSAYIGRNPYFW